MPLIMPAIKIVIISRRVFFIEIPQADHPLNHQQEPITENRLNKMLPKKKRKENHHLSIKFISRAPHKTMR